MVEAGQLQLKRPTDAAMAANDFRYQLHQCAYALVVFVVDHTNAEVEGVVDAAGEGYKPHQVEY